MHVIYQHIAKISVEIEEEYQKTVKGEKVTATRKKNKKQDTTLVFTKPSALMMEEADFFFGQKYNYYINAGFLTRAMMQKKVADNGGNGADKDDELKTVLHDYFEATKEVEFYDGKKNLDKDQKESLVEAKKTVGRLELYITEYQMNLSSMYSQTADNLAEQKLMEWFVLNFLYTKETVDGETEYFPFFDGHEYDEKRELYLSLLEEEGEDISKKKKLLDVSFEKIVQAITIWRNGLADNTKDIDAKINELFKEPVSGV